MTGEGAARAEVDRPAAGEPAFLLVLTHGAGGEPDSPDLLAVAGAALGLGGAVARVTQPYRVKGRRAPGSPDRQDAAWAEVIAALRAAAGPGLPLVQGGRSNGARVACRTAPRGRRPGRDRPRLPAAPAGEARPVARGRAGRRGDGRAGTERRSGPVRDPGGLGKDAGRGAGGGDAHPVPPPGRDRAGRWILAPGTADGGRLIPGGEIL